MSLLLAQTSKSMKTRWNTQAGFTLIELMVVVFIMGVLAALALPAYASMVRRARYAEARHQMGAIAKDIQVYQMEKGQFPPDVNGNIKPEGVENWPQQIPYDSYYDYDHWGVGNNQCYVQIGYAGESGKRVYPLHKLNAPPPGFEEFGDNLVLGVALYECGRGRGSIR
jgi:general secretion pathway protein G/type IV pilus assembly protein PilA